MERALWTKATANRTPINATIELTPTCNFRCGICAISAWRSHNEKKRRITEHRGICVADQLQEIGTFHLTDRRRAPTLSWFQKNYISGWKKKGFILTHQYKRDFDRWRNSTSVSTFETRVNVSLYGVWPTELISICCHATNGCLETETIKEYGIRYQTEPHLDTTKYKRTPANAGTSWRNGTYLCWPTVAFSVYSRPGMRHHATTFDTRPYRMKWHMPRST